MSESKSGWKVEFLKDDKRVFIIADDVVFAMSFLSKEKQVVINPVMVSEDFLISSEDNIVVYNF